jgi:hypothetical protein
MYDTLYQYLIFNRQLNLPGIGTIHLQRMPAQFDHTNSLLTPPQYSFRMDTGNDKPSKKLFDWLSGSLGITEWDAIRMVNDFSFELKKNIGAAREIHWKNVGTVRRNETGSIVIEPEQMIVEQPVSVERRIHDRTEHKATAVDMENPPPETEELFAAEKDVKKDYGWIAALILTLAALMFAGWYFSEKGMNPPAAGNQSVIKQSK